MTRIAGGQFFALYRYVPGAPFATGNARQAPAWVLHENPDLPWAGNLLRVIQFLTRYRTALPVSGATTVLLFHLLASYVSPL